MGSPVIIIRHLCGLHMSHHAHAQAGDKDAVQAAVEPALAAITAGAHKLSQRRNDSGSPELNAWVAGVRREAPFLLRYTASWIYTAMATTAVALLEKQRRYQEATELLQQLLGRWK